MKKPKNGFTLIEMMVVIAVIAVLALIALPSYQSKMVRDQIIEGSTLATLAKAPIATQWSISHTLPADNAAAGLPVAEKIVNNVVRAMTVQAGAIHITYGNHANGILKDKTLTLRPAVIEDAQVVPVTWVCGNSTAPDKMTLLGENKTDIPKDYLPLNCK